MSTSVAWERARVEVERERRRRKSDDANLTGNDAEFARCAADPAYFIDTYVIIDDAQGDGTGTMPFRLWDDQRSALGHLLNDRLVIFLKARQLGISWLCLGFALWLMVFHPGKTTLLFSQGETEALEMLRRLKAMYERLPDWMLAKLPRRFRDNTSEQGWSNGSWCKSMPATKRAGRSFTASLVIMDEAAHQQYGGKLYAALKPTIDGGGKLFVVSSANGADGFFNRLWQKAEGRLNDFRPIFLPWSSRPGRDQDWYDRQVAESTDPELVKQEYPNNSVEAFVASGRTRFRPEWVADQHSNLRDPLPIGQVPEPLRKLDRLSFFSGPALGRKYLLTADVAEGLEKGDFSTGAAIDLVSGEEMASLHGKWEPGEFADALFALACFYNCPIAPERNNHGHAVILRLNQLVIGPKVSSRVYIVKGDDRRPGWVTSNASKPLAVDCLAESLRDGTVIIRNRVTLSEIQDYAVGPAGKTSAPTGQHDDMVTAWFIFCGLRARMLSDSGPLAY